MPLSLVDAATTNNALTNTLDGFTTISMPKTKKPSNTDPVAWKLFLAQRMSSFADAFKKSATKEAVEAGVLFDHSKTPRDAGIDEDIYSGDVVRINLKTKNGSQRFDDKLFFLKAAERLKLTDTQVQLMHQLVTDCTKQNAAPHTFTASIKT